MMHRILWPDRQTVSDDTVVGWALDALADGEIWTPWLNEDELRADPVLAADLLHDAGLITLAATGENR